MGFNPSEYDTGGKTLNADKMKEWGLTSTLLTIADVGERNYEAKDDRPAARKLTLIFNEVEEELPLNVPNHRFMSKIDALDTDAWIGEQVVLTLDNKNPSMAWVALSTLPTSTPPPRPASRPTAPVAQSAPKPAPRPVPASVPQPVEGDPFAEDDPGDPAA